MASRWISSVAVPYSSSYSSALGLPGQLARLAHRHEPGAEVVGDRRREDEPARLDARRPCRRCRGRSARRSGRSSSRTRCGSASSGVMSLKTMPGSGKSGTSRIERLDLHRCSTASPPPALGRRASLALGTRARGRPPARARLTGRGGGGHRGRRRPPCSSSATLRTVGRHRAETRSLVPRVSSRARSCWYRGSRSFRTARIGVATKIDE